MNFPLFKKQGLNKKLCSCARPDTSDHMDYDNLDRDQKTFKNLSDDELLQVVEKNLDQSDIKSNIHSFLNKNEKNSLHLVQSQLKLEEKLKLKLKNQGYVFLQNQYELLNEYISEVVIENPEIHELKIKNANVKVTSRIRILTVTESTIKSCKVIKRDKVIKKEKYPEAKQIDLYFKEIEQAIPVLSKQTNTNLSLEKTKQPFNFKNFNFKKYKNEAYLFAGIFAFIFTNRLYLKPVSQKLSADAVSHMRMDSRDQIAQQILSFKKQQINLASHLKVICKKQNFRQVLVFERLLENFPQAVQIKKNLATANVNPAIVKQNTQLPLASISSILEPTKKPNSPTISLTNKQKLNDLSDAFFKFLYSIKTKNQILCSLPEDRIALTNHISVISNRLNLPRGFGFACQNTFSNSLLVQDSSRLPKPYSYYVSFKNLMWKTELMTHAVLSSPPINFQGLIQRPVYITGNLNYQPWTNSDSNNSDCNKSLRGWFEVRPEIHPTEPAGCWSIKVGVKPTLILINANFDINFKKTNQNSVVNDFFTKNKQMPYASIGSELVPRNSKLVPKNNNASPSSSGTTSQAVVPLEIEVTYLATGEIEKVRTVVHPKSIQQINSEKPILLLNQTQNEQMFFSTAMLSVTGLAFIAGSLFLPEKEFFLKKAVQRLGVFCLGVACISGSGVVELTSNTAGQAVNKQIINPLVNNGEILINQVKQHPVFQLIILNLLYNQLKNSEFFSDLLKVFCQLGNSPGDDWFGFGNCSRNQPWDPDPYSYLQELTVNTVCFGSINQPISVTFAKNIYPHVKNVLVKGQPSVFGRLV